MTANHVQSPLYRLSLLTALVLLSPPLRADEAMPVYRFEVGQELSYQATSHFEYERGSHDYEQTWRFWVVEKNEDGSWRMIVKESMSAQAGRVNLAYFDMFPDGRIVPNDSLGFQVDPAAVFVRLPQDAAQLKQGWESVDAQKDVRRTHRSAEVDSNAADGPDSSELIVDVDQASPMDEIYLIKNESTVTFDKERGLVTRVETRTTQEHGINGKATGEVRLDAVEQRDAAWIETLRKDVETYFVADKRYQELAEQSQHDASKIAAKLEEAKGALMAARDSIATGDLKDLLNTKLLSHDSMVDYYTESAKRRAEIMDQPAYAFDTEDLEGNVQKLSDYRGKVVVLDFWYRGCGWCIRAMPQIKEIVEDYKDQPVVVFGMNTDANEDDAHFVIEKMALNYANLNAAGLPEKYGVQGFPTLIIIDQEGDVRDIHVGYSPDLTEKVSAKIEELLGDAS